MSKINVYYLSAGGGLSRKTGKPYKTVRVLSYNAYFGRWGETVFFVDAYPALCEQLTSGDYVEIEISQGLQGSARLLDICRKLGDSPLISG